ncbi:hypothetical protein RFI_13456 [Reticulomyxa filosa]|uniref:Uncharacterized protein n=1 Tax=Reticulomyxa filosa TaxID=46433 RepID=X6NCL0_RETFI|nr:hypothetical protein RFI_13456 [Reticulomyxa filosa]|eukprot:ETO23726.1 hypothetical protein RFI_13456 [Reticulomyxa filosa]
MPTLDSLNFSAENSDIVVKPMVNSHRALKKPPAIPYDGKDTSARRKDVSWQEFNKYSLYKLAVDAWKRCRELEIENNNIIQQHSEVIRNLVTSAHQSTSKLMDEMRVYSCSFIHSFIHLFVCLFIERDKLVDAHFEEICDLQLEHNRIMELEFDRSEKLERERNEAHSKLKSMEVKHNEMSQKFNSLVCFSFLKKKKINNNNWKSTN